MALILGVPLAPALAALVFLGAFIPLVGALVSGFVAVLVALVALGWVQALIMLGGIIVVMQLEGHVLQPFLLGRAVKLHPLAVLLAIAIGIVIAGIVGALIAVPILAFVKTFVQELYRQSHEVVQPAEPPNADRQAPDKSLCSTRPPPERAPLCSWPCSARLRSALEPAGVAAPDDGKACRRARPPLGGARSGGRQVRGDDAPSQS